MNIPFPQNQKVKEEYPEARCMATMMKDLLNNGHLLLFYSCRVLKCKNYEYFAISVLCSKFGMFFNISSVKEHKYISTSFKDLLSQHR
jgi:hypothetical protein